VTTIFRTAPIWGHSVRVPDVLRSRSAADRCSPAIDAGRRTARTTTIALGTRFAREGRVRLARRPRRYSAASPFASTAVSATMNFAQLSFRVFREEVVLELLARVGRFATDRTFDRLLRRHASGTPPERKRYRPEFPAVGIGPLTARDRCTALPSVSDPRERRPNRLEVVAIGPEEHETEQAGDADGQPLAVERVDRSP